MVFLYNIKKETHYIYLDQLRLTCDAKLVKIILKKKIIKLNLQSTQC